MTGLPSSLRSSPAQPCTTTATATATEHSNNDGHLNTMYGRREIENCKTENIDENIKNSSKNINNTTTTYNDDGYRKNNRNLCSYLGSSSDSEQHAECMATSTPTTSTTSPTSQFGLSETSTPTCNTNNQKTQNNKNKNNNNDGIHTARAPTSDEGSDHNSTIDGDTAMDAMTAMTTTRSSNSYYRRKNHSNENEIGTSITDRNMDTQHHDINGNNDDDVNRNHNNAETKTTSMNSMENKEPKAKNIKETNNCTSSSTSTTTITIQQLPLDKQQELEPSTSIAHSSTPSKNDNDTTAGTPSTSNHLNSTTTTTTNNDTTNNANDNATTTNAATTTTIPTPTSTSKIKINEHKRTISFNEQNILDTTCTTCGEKSRNNNNTVLLNNDSNSIMKSRHSHSQQIQHLDDDESLKSVDYENCVGQPNINSQNQSMHYLSSNHCQDKSNHPFLIEDHTDILIPDLTKTIKTASTTTNSAIPATTVTAATEKSTIIEKEDSKDYLQSVHAFEDPNVVASSHLSILEELLEEDVVDSNTAMEVPPDTNGILQDNEESSSSSSLDSITSKCLPIPNFIYRLICINNKRRKINSIEDVAKQIALEYELWKDGIERNNDKDKINHTRVVDIGLALFHPFDFYTWDNGSSININNTHLVTQQDTAFDDDNLDSDLSLSDDEDSCSDSAISECSFEDILMEHDPEEETIPRILSLNQMKEINRRGLPPSVQLMTWKRAYSLTRDGDYFGTMFRQCSFFKHTLIVIKTINGDILGGYADTPWAEQKKSGSLQRSLSFFGSGRAFLFATCPDVTDEQMQEELKARRSSRDSMFFYNWTGENDYSQVCDNEKGSLGMGGGGEFGFYVQRDFTLGSTGSCHTFGNPPLVKRSDGGSFEILDLEVYGFSSMSERLSPRRSFSFGSFSKQSIYSSQRSLAHMSPTSSVASFLE